MIRKYASAAIIDARMADDPRLFAKSAHRAVFNYVPKPGYLYVRSRAISSRCNDNFDMFPAEEIEKSYLTFIGKPVFVNHHNDDHRRMRGVIIDAALHRDRNPDGTPDTWVELLHEVDAVKFPKLAKAILAKEVDRTSMGCDVQFSKCSACGNVATSPMNYCQHIPGKKGKRIFRQMPDGRREGVLVYEICSGLSFFENSLLVEQPADPTAFFLGEVESGPGLEHLHAAVQKTATRRAEPSLNTPVREVSPTQPTMAKMATNTSRVWGLLKQAARETANVNVEADAGLPVPTQGPHVSKIWSLISEANQVGDDLTDDLFTVGSLDDDRVDDHAYWNRIGNIQPPTSDWRHRAHVARLNEEEPQAPLVPPKNAKDMNPDEKKEWRGKVKAHADEWAKRNPVHPQNIIDHFNHATDEEKHNGMNWYADAHHTSNLLADGTGTPRHVMAGLVSNYSPQTHWATNVITAAKSARLKVGLGGKGNQDGHSQFPETTPKGTPHPRAGQQRGIMASEGQKQVAEKLLTGTHDEDETREKGAHYDQVLKGPKTKAFARLIHNGGDDHSVVVDRHAYSVAAGARASDAAYGHSGLGGKKKYEEVSSAYQQASSHLSKQHGVTIHPHQVQATTWLVRQRLNEEGDSALKQQGRSSAAAARRSISEMHNYLGEHHPEASVQMPGTGYSKDTGLVTQDPDAKEKKSASASPNFTTHAYGDTKAPQDVDTLREESCTVCGNSSAFDGTQCQVCGYVAPPRAFGDPNTDIAKAQDLRKQVLDGDQADPNDPDQQLGNQVGNPDELQDQAAEAESGEDDQTQSLTCTNCGTGIQPAPPASTGGEPPYPAEGDVCPVCQKGELASGGSEEDPEAGDEEDPKSTDSNDVEDSDEAPEDMEDDSDDDDEKGKNPFAKKKDK